jgi:hypothetical protein
VTRSTTQQNWAYQISTQQWGKASWTSLTPEIPKGSGFRARGTSESQIQMQGHRREKEVK